MNKLSHRGRIAAVLIALSLIAGSSRAGEEEICEDPALTAPAPSPLLSFHLKRLQGGEQALASYQGQVLLLVNVASKCGLTPQYDGLEALYETFRDQGFAVLGFPSNDFAGQEPGGDHEIAEFCRSTYGVRFPMFSKIHVKGEGIHPLYRYLTGLPQPVGGEVEWNFQKYLVSRSGEVLARFAPRTEPDAPELIAAIEQLLAEDL